MGKYVEMIIKANKTLTKKNEELKDENAKHLETIKLLKTEIMELKRQIAAHKNQERKASGILSELVGPCSGGLLKMIETSQKRLDDNELFPMQVTPYKD